MARRPAGEPWFAELPGGGGMCYRRGGATIRRYVRESGRGLDTPARPPSSRRTVSNALGAHVGHNRGDSEWYTPVTNRQLLDKPRECPSCHDFRPGGMTCAAARAGPWP